MPSEHVRIGLLFDPVWHSDQPSVHRVIIPAIFKLITNPATHLKLGVTVKYPLSNKL